MLQLHTTWPTPVSLAIMRRNNVSLPFLSFSRVSKTLFFHFFTATNNHIGKNSPIIIHCFLCKRQYTISMRLCHLLFWLSGSLSKTRLPKGIFTTFIKKCHATRDGRKWWIVYSRDEESGAHISRNMPVVNRIEPTMWAQSVKKNVTTDSLQQTAIPRSKSKSGKKCRSTTKKSQHHHRICTTQSSKTRRIAWLSHRVLFQ